MSTTHQSWKLATTSRYGLSSVAAVGTLLLKFTFGTVNCTRWKMTNSSSAIPPQRIHVDLAAPLAAERTAYRFTRAPLALAHRTRAA